MSKKFKIVSDEKEYRWSEKFIPFKELKKAILINLPRPTNTVQ